MPRKRKRTNKLSKVGNISFLFSTLATCFLSIALPITAFIGLSEAPVDLTRVGVFIGASLLFALACRKLRFARLRTFIHELKHAVVVVLSGNRLTKFRAGAGTGYVEYVLFQDQVRFAPMIMLAPYFWPLLSAPVLIACLILENRFPLELAGTLGAALAIDVVTGYEEIHPQQSDLKRIYGGSLIAKLFIVSALVLWLAVCSIWLIGLSSGYLTVANTAYVLGLETLEPFLGTDAKLRL